MWEEEEGEREAVPMKRVQGFYSLLSKAEHLSMGFICPGADGPVLHPCGQAGGRWAVADAEPQRAFCHLEISQEVGLSHTGGGRGTGKRCLGEL